MFEGPVQVFVFEGPVQVFFFFSEEKKCAPGQKSNRHTGANGGRKIKTDSEAKKKTKGPTGKRK